MAAKKVLIDDICDVLNNHWPSEDWYMEDCGEAYSEDSHGLLKFDKFGKYAPKEPRALVNLADFDFFFAWQGKGEPDKQMGSFAGLFRRVQKAKTTTSLVVDVPKDKEAQFRAAVAKMGKGFKIQ